MLEYVGWSIGGMGLLSTVFMVGHNVASKNKLENMMKKDDCIRHRDDLNKQLNAYRILVDDKMGLMHEKINEVAKSTARIEGYLTKDADNK